MAIQRQIHVTQRLHINIICLQHLKANKLLVVGVYKMAALVIPNLILETNLKYL